MSGIERKSLEDPDGRTDYGREGDAAQVTIGFNGFGIGNESTLWRSNLKAGWSWLRNVKPTVPFDSCPLHHREYVISGRIRYTMSDGEVVEAQAGDHLMISPGHLAEVVGDEPCVLLDW